jgi:hypothetical protein
VLIILELERYWQCTTIQVRLGAIDVFYEVLKNATTQYGEVTAHTYKLGTHYMRFSQEMRKSSLYRLFVGSVRPYNYVNLLKTTMTPNLTLVHPSP